MSKSTATATATAMTREAAESVTAEIREHGKSLVTARTKFAGAVKRAREGQAHVALGLKSWPEYVATVFADMPGLGKADHEYLTAFMAGEGMSSRAVARVLGVSQSTAARMIRQAEESGKVATDRKVEGTDGKAQGKGKGKGRAKGAAAKGKGKGKPEGIALSDLDSTALGALALDALAILNTRWMDKGDDDAAGALTDITALLSDRGLI